MKPLHTAMIAVMLSTPLQVQAQQLSEVQLLKQQLKLLQQRIEALEAKQTQAATATTSVSSKPPSTSPTPSQQASKVAQAAPASKGTIELKQEKTVMSIGGRLQLNAFLSSPEVSYGAKSVPVPEISGEDGQFSMNARDSRIWIKTQTPTSAGVLRTLIETDFFGSAGTETISNSHNLRLRHAYMDINGLAIGQTNSVFNTKITPDTVLTPINDAFVRQPLIRYSGNAESWGYDLSLEQPETTLIDSFGVIINPQDDAVPDMAGRLRYYPEWGEAAISGLVRHIRHDQTTLSDNSALGNRDSEWGWGINASAKLLAGVKDDFRVNAQYGSGIGRYLAYNTFAAGSIDSNGKIKLQNSYGVNLSYRHWWNSSLRSTLAWAKVGTDNHSGIATDITKEVHSWQANLMWTPVANTLVGLGYASAKRELENGNSGELDVMRMIFRYDF